MKIGDMLFIEWDEYPKTTKELFDGWQLEEGDTVYQVRVVKEFEIVSKQELIEVKKLKEKKIILDNVTKVS